LANPIEMPQAGSGPVNRCSDPVLVSWSAVSLPTIPSWPGTNINWTLLCRDSKCGRVLGLECKQIWWHCFGGISGCIWYQEQTYTYILRKDIKIVKHTEWSLASPLSLPIWQLQCTTKHWNKLLHVKSQCYTFDTGCESLRTKIYIATFNVLVHC
jgi:hypothetical protein